jgi:hypothetical protein
MERSIILLDGKPLSFCFEFVANLGCLAFVSPVGVAIIFTLIVRTA